MRRRTWILGLLFLALVGGFALMLRFSASAPAAAPGSAANAMADERVARPGAPARLCARPAQAVLRGLREGALRAVVVVRAFQPAQQGSSGLAVSLVGASGIRAELARVAVHPLRAFAPGDPSQRFLVSLAPVAHLMVDGQPLCIEVGFDGAGGSPEGGMAEIDVEFVRTP